MGYAVKNYARRSSLDHALDAAHEAIVRAGGEWEEVVTYDNPLGRVFDFVDLAVRKRERRERREEALGTVDPPAMTTYLFGRDEDLAEGISRWLAVRVAIQTLPPMQQAVIVRRFFLDIDLRTIARNEPGYGGGNTESAWGRAANRIHPAVIARLLGRGGFINLSLPSLLFRRDQHGCDASP